MWLCLPVTRSAVPPLASSLDLGSVACIPPFADCMLTCTASMTSLHPFTRRPPCVMADNPTPKVCLYNLANDPTERNNLANDPEQAERVKSLLARLIAIGSTGPPLSSAFPTDVGLKNSTATAESCSIEGKTGYLLPLDWKK